MKKNIILAIFAVVILAACGRSTTVAPQILPGQTQGQPAVESAVPVLQGNDALNTLSSYRTKITMLTEKNGAVESNFVIIQEETRNPAAKRWFYDTSTSGQESKMEIISIEGKQWMNIGGSWMMSEQSPEDAAKAFGSDALNNFDVVGEFNKGNYSLVGSESVNGLNAKHYVLNMTAAELTAFTMGMTDVTNSKVDVWVADGAGLPAFTVKYVMSVEGKKEGVPSKFTMSSEVYDINQPISIQLPPEAANSGMPADIPAYAGATDMFTSQGMISFKTTDSADAVKAYYEQNLPANGWAKQTSEMEMFLTYTKEGRTIQLMITAEENGSGTSAIFMITGQ